MADVRKEHTPKKPPEVCKDRLVVDTTIPGVNNGTGRGTAVENARVKSSSPELTSKPTDGESESPEAKAKALSDAEFKYMPSIRSLSYKDHLATLKGEMSPLTAKEKTKLAAFRQFKNYPLIADLTYTHAKAKSIGEQSSLSLPDRALAWSFHEFRDWPLIRDLAYQSNLAELRGERKSPLSQKDQEKLEMYRTLKFDPELVELATLEEQGQFLTLDQQVRLNSHKKYGELTDPELRAWAFQEARARLESKPNPLTDNQIQFMQIEHNLNKKMQYSTQHSEEAKYWGIS